MANIDYVLDLYAEPYNPERPMVCFDVNGGAKVCRAGG